MSLPAGASEHGGIGHTGAVEVLDALCNDVFDGRVSLAANPLFVFPFGGDPGCTIPSFSADAILGAGLAYSFSRLLTNSLSARGIGSPSFTNA
jgi:hypothetical protein